MKDKFVFMFDKQKLKLTFLLFGIFMFSGSIFIAVLMIFLMPEYKTELLVGYCSGICANLMSFALIFFYVEILYNNQVTEYEKTKKLDVEDSNSESKK